MQERLTLKTSSLIATLTGLLLIALMMSLSVASPVSAQFEEPTATPTDPIWLGFSTARTAIEEAEGVNLSLVQKWEFWQDDWSTPNGAHPQQAGGIDSCVSTVGIMLARDIYYGWTFVITALNGNSYEARVSFDLQDVALCDIRTETVAAPAAPAEGGENVDLPAPIVGAGATGSFELGGHVDGMTGAAIAAMNQSGMKWVKKQLPTGAGVSKGYEMINDAHGNGFKILLGIVGDKAALGADPDGYAQEYATFVRAMAEAGADAIEVWNEPNIDREWPQGQINGANYTKLLATSYNAIKGVNPNTMVVSGAPAPTGFFGAAGCGTGGCNDDVFMQQMAQAGAGQFMDCVGLHYNEGVLPPTANSGDPRGEYPTYYFSSMTNRAKTAFPDKPICYTELGYLSGEGMGAPIPPGFDWTPNDPITVAEQAQYLAGAAAAAAQRGDVRLMIIWNVNFTRWDSDPMGGYAIIRPGGDCPACGALGQVMGGS